MTYQSIDPMKNTGMILDLIAKKQKAIGENLSNIDTPGYVRQDVNFGDYLSASNSPLETKLSEKLGPSPIFSESAEGEVNPAHELIDMQRNALLYTMATRRMSNIISEMKTVINVGK